MIRLALVEDDELYRSQLREYIDKYSAVSGEKFTVTEFSDGDEIALGYKAVYDIILMDIEMKFMDGMMAAEEIRKVDTEVIIILYAQIRRSMPSRAMPSMRWTMC